jgi:uridine kinase
MIGDKLIIKKRHTEIAGKIYDVISDIYVRPFVISIAGESGAGKSEIASELCRVLQKNSIKTVILQQDDYFVFPPKTNHLMRLANQKQIGTFEVKLDFLDSNLRSFKRGECSLYKPLVNFDLDLILTEEIDLKQIEILIVEGTYTSLLHFTDFKVFLESNYRETLSARNERNREKNDPFIEVVLEKEHGIINKHRELADIRIGSDFQRIVLKK